MEIDRSLNEVTDDLAHEERPVVLMALILGLLCAASSAVLIAAPGLPVDIHEALASLPCLITS